MKELNAFSNYEKWSEIQKQGIFEAWIPYVLNRPLDFFVPKHEASNEGFLTDVISDCSKDSLHKVVIPLKRRKVVILTSDELCQDVYVQDVQIAKIISIKERDKGGSWYKQLISDQHPFHVYLPEHITGIESYINLAQPMTIGKKLLITNYNKLLPKDRMMLVEDRIVDLIELGVIKEDLEAINE